MQDCTEITSCRLCGGEITDLFSLGKTPLANSYLRKEDLDKPEVEYPLDLVLCEQCGSFQLKHSVAPEIMFSNYLYESSTSASFRQHFKDFVSILPEIGLQRGDFVVEIGSNDGILLHPLKEVGYDILGVEPAKNLAQKCNDAGLTTINDFFNVRVAERIVKERGRAQLIVANNVMAHCAIDDVMRGVVELLGSGGCFVFEVVDLAEMYKNKCFDLCYHEHYFCHSIKPLKRLMKKYGMELFEVEKLKVHGGSLRCFARHARGSWINWPSIDRQIQMEEELGLYKKETWFQFYKDIEQSKRNLLNLFRGLKESRQTICGFGAPAKVTTLMHFLDIGKETIDFIVDDAVAKQNLFTPGKKIPIGPKSWLYEKPNTHCALTAWNFAANIMRANPEYKGRWIKIFPEIEMI